MLVVPLLWVPVPPRPTTQAIVNRERSARARECVPRIPPTASVDRPLDDLFRGQLGPGWIGGDATYSTPLPGGAEAFVFSDTLIGTAWPYGPAQLGGLAANSELVGSLPFLRSVYGGSNRSPRPLIPDRRGGGRRWEVAATEVVHRVQVVFVNEFTPVQHSTFGRFTGRSGMAVLSLSASGVPTFRSITPLPTGARTQWGNALVVGRRDTYVYGATSDTSTGAFYGMRLARVPSGAILDTRSWRYWDGRRWVAGERHAVDLRTHQALTGVTPRPAGGGYVAVSIPGGVLDDRTVDLSYACSPEGPWSRPKAVYSIPEVLLYRNEIAYIPTFHPELSPPGSLVVSYNVDTTDGPVSLAYDVHRYQPRFVLLHLSPGRPPARSSRSSNPGRSVPTCPLGRCPTP